MTERQDSQVSYMWEEYTLTFGSAQEYRDPSKTNIPDLKKAIAVLKSEIRGLGSVNVNAIEDYKELLERHTFLTTQHEDLLKAEEALIRIIAELVRLTDLVVNRLPGNAELPRNFSNVHSTFL